MKKRARAPRREREMSLGQHLIELRRRLFISGVSIAIGAVVGWFLSEAVWRLLAAPVHAVAGNQDRQASINFDTISGAFDLRVQLAIQIGLIISAPVWLYQVFAFIVPGLTRRESRITMTFLFTAIPLFTTGVVAGAWILPHMVELMTSFAPAETASYVNAGTYYDFVLKLLLAVGVAFTLPLFLVLLNVIGLLSGVAILRGWRYALLGIFLFTAIATPAADVLAMLLLAVPMIALYLGAGGYALIADKRRARVSARAGTLTLEIIAPSDRT